MRLLNTTTHKVEEHNPRSTPDYAILSHTWGSEEVSLQDMDSGRAKSKAGYRKLVKSCHEAKRLGYAWIWNDTCCIDKTSSSELSEAINSMFKWYQKAGVCLAYVSDISSPCECRVMPEDIQTLDDIKKKCKCGFASAFCSSRWFTRGWTLQELIAPEKIIFYSASWVELGTKASFGFMIAATTGIDVYVLKDIWGLSLESRLSVVPVAGKMSWVSKRNTTREEDIAYCLMGIFDVNMSLLYGEGGEKAFLRLQMEIFETTEDHSLFAWNCPLNPPSDFRTWSGLLAAKPAAFADCGNVINLKPQHEVRPSVTKRGVYLPLNQIHPIAVPWNPYDLSMVVLDSCRLHMKEAVPIFWLLKCGENEYIRATLSSTAELEESWFAYDLFRRLPDWAEGVMQTKHVSQRRLSEVLKNNAETNFNPQPRLAFVRAFVRHKVEPLSLHDAIMIDIKQAPSSTFEVIKGFPPVGVNVDYDPCIVKGGRSRGVNGFGRLIAFAALLIRDQNGNHFFLTLDAIGDIRNPWTGWLSLHASLGVDSSLGFNSLKQDSSELDSPEQLLTELAQTYLTPRHRESKTPCLELRDVMPGITITAKWRWSSSQKLNMVFIECS